MLQSSDTDIDCKTFSLVVPLDINHLYSWQLNFECIIFYI